MPEAVVNGAVIECDQGSMPGRLLIDHHVRANEAAGATVADCVPYTNITPMGVCKLSALACQPATTPWKPPTGANINGVPMIDANATCQCSVGGVIRIVDPGTMVTINGAGRAAARESPRYAERAKPTKYLNKLLAEPWLDASTGTSAQKVGHAAQEAPREPGPSPPSEPDPSAGGTAP